MVPFPIGCIDDTLFGLLPDVLYRLSSIEPKLHPILRTFPSPQLAKFLEEGMISVALALPEKIPNGSNITYKEIGKTPLVCICDETHPFSERKSLLLSDMEESNLIFFRPSLSGMKITTLQSQLGKDKNPDSIFFCDTLSASFALARAGFGALVLPLVLIPDFIPGLNKIPIVDFNPISFGVYFKSDSGPLIRKFISLLKEEHKERKPKFPQFSLDALIK